MTKAELSQILNISINTIEKKFKNLQNNYKKKGIIIEKKGKGENSEYFIKNLYFKPKNTLYEEKDKVIYFNNEIIEWPNFCSLIAFSLLVINSKQTAVLMSYVDFLNYLEIKPTINNIKNLKKAFEWMNENKIINYMKDNLEPEKAFMASWIYSYTKTYKMQIQFFNDCKKLIKKYNKDNKWIIALMKTWIGLLEINNEVYTVNEFTYKFNISSYQFKECKDILIKEGFLIQNRVYNNSYNYDEEGNEKICFYVKGLKYDLNIFSPIINIK